MNHLGAAMDQLVSLSIPELLKNHETAILNDWIKEQKLARAGSKINVSDEEIAQQSKQFLKSFQLAAQGGQLNDIDAPAWEPVRILLDEISKMRSERGQTTEQTATFIFSLKQPVAFHIQKLSANAEQLTADLWSINVLLDKLGLYTLRVYQIARENIIKRQQEELLELSTPVLRLWDGILALPMIGTLDSNRTQIIMENLLQKILEYNCEIAIIDITGVPNVDTLVAQHLLKAVTAARLMGTECIISGIRPQIAQTIVHLGVELGDVITKANLIDAFRYSLKLLGKNLSEDSLKTTASN